MTEHEKEKDNNCKKEVIGNIYNRGDGYLKILNILKTTKELIYVCLIYSENHKTYNVESFSKSDFDSYKFEEVPFFMENEIIFEQFNLY